METTNTELPNVGDRVWYMLPSQRFTAAIVIRAHGENSVDLVVFADPSEGGEYATDTAPKMHVSRYMKKEGDVYPTRGTWFVPAGMGVPHQ